VFNVHPDQGFEEFTKEQESEFEAWKARISTAESLTITKL